ncbi:hypothetical protein O181_107661 [Austropuccinia psidii MF-1]|uniref:Uncharacterized protein n=1 Tax=Austropuccinia psidii MF-1 TaxID=1389203 RepID=A0A9Q3JTA6_9BASI|nr:hypothetical protein [Austropuccinia psidii MF-1]
MGPPYHGSLNAAEWALLYKVFIPLLMLSQQMSLDEHKYANTQRKVGLSEEIANELTKNKFHSISAIKIATNSTVSMDDVTAFAEHCKNFCLSNQHLFPKQKIKPNNHFSDHIPKVFQRLGPVQASSTWGYECLIGIFHQGESRVNRWQLTSRQASVKQDESRSHIKQTSSTRPTLFLQQIL